jgi:Mrp family chromosome partitioning ATPase
MDFSIRLASRLERITGLKNIGSVNMIKTAGFNLIKTFSNKNVDKESEIFIHFLRKLRYEVQTSKSKVFLITSTQVKVGKSFIIICLSYTLSLINKKVLIIDTNFRHNSLTKMLLPKIDHSKLLKKGVEEKLTEIDPKEPGSREPDNGHEYEANKDSQKDYTRNGSNGSSHGPDDKSSDQRSIIYRTEFQGVDIIGNMGGFDSPSEILAGRDFKEVINNLTSHYDYILMEGSSLNEYSDSKELIEYVDKVITVFGAETVLNFLDKESIQYLKSVKGKMLGTVLNKVQMKDLV